MWDMYSVGPGTWALRISDGTYEGLYDQIVPVGEHLNMAAELPVGFGGYISMKLYWKCCNMHSGKTIFIDNIRIIPPTTEPTHALGRIVGGNNSVRIT